MEDRFLEWKPITSNAFKGLPRLLYCIYVYVYINVGLRLNCCYFIPQSWHIGFKMKKENLVRNHRQYQKRVSVSPRDQPPNIAVDVRPVPAPKLPDSTLPVIVLFVIIYLLQSVHFNVFSHRS